MVFWIDLVLGWRLVLGWGSMLGQNTFGGSPGIQFPKASGRWDDPLLLSHCCYCCCPTPLLLSFHHLAPTPSPRCSRQPLPTEPKDQLRIAICHQMLTRGSEEGVETSFNAVTYILGVIMRRSRGSTNRHWKGVEDRAEDQDLLLRNQGIKISNNDFNQRCLYRERLIGDDGHQSVDELWSDIAVGRVSAHLPGESLHGGLLLCDGAVGTVVHEPAQGLYSRLYNAVIILLGGGVKNGENEFQEGGNEIGVMEEPWRVVWSEEEEIRQE